MSRRLPRGTPLLDSSSGRSVVRQGDELVLSDEHGGRCRWPARDTGGLQGALLVALAGRGEAGLVAALEAAVAGVLRAQGKKVCGADPSHLRREEKAQ